MNTVEEELGNDPVYHSGDRSYWLLGLMMVSNRTYEASLVPVSDLANLCAQALPYTQLPAYLYICIYIYVRKYTHSHTYAPACLSLSLCLS